MRIYLGLLASLFLVLTVYVVDVDSAFKPGVLKSIKPETLKNIRQKISQHDGLSASLKKQLLGEHKSGERPLPVRNDKVEKPNEPNPSLNLPLNQTQKDELDSTVFLTQFLQFIFTGRYDGQTEYVDSAFDDNNLDTLIGLGIIVYIQVIQDDPPDDAIEIIADLVRIQDLLRENGSLAVILRDLKPYLTYDTAVGMLSLYVALSSDSWAERFAIYLDQEFLGGVKTPECKLHSALWFSAFPNDDWAVLMFDAFAKLPPGISQGNINWMGSYETCVDIKKPDFHYFDFHAPIYGKYCRADISIPVEQFVGDLPIYDVSLAYGVCMSRYCNVDDVASIVSNILKLITVFHYADVKQVECVEEKYELPTSTLVWTILLSILVGFVVFCTLFEIVLKIVGFARGETSEPENPEVIKSKLEIVGQGVIKTNKPEKRQPKIVKFLIECSMYTNTAKLFKTDNGGKIACLNGIRMFSMFWIIFGHTFNYVAGRDKFFLLDNIFQIQKLNEELYAQFIINGIFGVDTFFLMSALLLTTSLLGKLEKVGRLTKFEWAYYYIHRYWRLMPPFMIIIILNIYVAPYLLRGPLLNPDTFPPYNEECREYWWAFLIFLNNFIPKGKGVGCMSYLWYIPNDYQFYALTPIIIYLLFKYPKAGYILLATLQVATLLTIAFLSANVYISRKKSIVDTLLDMWVGVYIKPYCRASPWIIGIVLGYIFFKFKKIKLDYMQVAIGWSLSAVLFASVLFGGFTNHAKDARRMEVWEYGIFFSMTKLCWALAVAWVIFACHNGYGGIVNTILARKIYLPITRMTFAAYLIHPSMMIIYYFMQESLFHATLITLIYLAIGHIVMTFILSYFYTMFFELPFVAIERLVYSPKGSAH